MEGNAALTTRGFDHAELVKDLRKQVTSLEDDLRVRSEEAEFAPALEAEYAEARDAERTAATYVTWRDERVTQVAVAWVLGTVFVRFCEDNGLIEWPFIAGPGERLADAVERHDAFFKENSNSNDRDWIIAAFNHLASSHPTVAGLFDKRYNPLWEITPSYEQATALLRFWRGRGDGVEVRYDFTDDEWDTRFLGDLYQDLSEHARKTYALLQTPEFVEEFILDLTLEPAIDEFGLKDLRAIDPACGSGHFLLGMFNRALKRWNKEEPGADKWELIRRTLDSVHGCDKNPFASSIARFRLLIAALHAAGRPRMNMAPDFPINVAVGDSLLHGRGAPGIQLKTQVHNGELRGSEPHTYRTEDVQAYASRDLLGISSYHVVVGNPPYITVKDKQENENYRNGYNACSGKYALSVPFAQRLFQLAIRTEGSDRAAGYVGQITANSFMKREFGKKLIEDFFRRKAHLTHIIDTSGAYIPGHGTPTVLLVGRNHAGRKNDPVRAVLSVRGEPSQPAIPSLGLVWSAILDQVKKPRSESEWISVDDFDRAIFSNFPWSLSGGGASKVVDTLDRAKIKLRSELDRSIGFASFPGQDDAFFMPCAWFLRREIRSPIRRPLITGESIRDWVEISGQDALAPYDWNQEPISFDVNSPWGRHLWTLRQTLGSTTDFDGGKRLDSDAPWWTWYRWIPARYKTQLSITFAEVATHNHFALDRGGKVFKQTAPVIKLPDDASEDDHLILLGILNSSTACFWLKEHCFPKGGSGMGRGVQSEDWMERFAFNSSNIEKLPLPEQPPLASIKRMNDLTRQLAQYDLPSLFEFATPSRELLQMAQSKQESIWNSMISVQEELDWKVYAAYNILNIDESGKLAAGNLSAIPEIKLGERAFEIALARKVAAGKAKTAWFTRHRSTPIIEIPDAWPQWYRDIVQARIDIIETRRDIALIERPECKRRWSSVPWEKREAEALRNWLLDRCEKPELWFALRDGVNHPRALTVSQLADQFRDDADMNSVAQLYATDHLNKRDLTLAQILEQAVADQHVPFLAALRYKDTGLRKRAQWEEVWDLQRKEDATGERLDIAVPPKYGSGDFRKTSYWSQRGKLDVPKERFISYPDASPDSDPTLLLGWAGWDHKDQAQALVNIVNDRTEQSGWDTARIMPLLAGLLEVMPWVKQWHGEYDAEWDGNPHEEYSTYLTDQRTRNQLTEDDLRAWRPVPATRGRRAAKKD